MRKAINTDRAEVQRTLVRYQFKCKCEIIIEWCFLKKNRLKHKTVVCDTEENTEILTDFVAVLL